MQYKNKPITIEAEQFFEDRPWPKGVFREPGATSCYVVTIQEQRVYIQDGEWVITEPDGVHHYPCKADIFAQRYEPL